MGSTTVEQEPRVASFEEILRQQLLLSAEGCNAAASAALAASASLCWRWRWQMATVTAARARSMPSRMACRDGQDMAREIRCWRLHTRRTRGHFRGVKGKCNRFHGLFCANVRCPMYQTRMTRRERETCGMLGGEGRGGATVPAQYSTSGGMQ